MKWISQTESMREADRYAIDKLRIPGLILMETAARSVVDQMMKSCEIGQKVLVLCGMGNNGGDGFAIARMLKSRGMAVRIFLSGPAASLMGDAKTNFEMLAGYQIPVLTQDQASVLEKLIDQTDWVVDALFGTGLDRKVDGLLSQIIQYVNKVHKRGTLRVMAVDIPSGVHGNSGQVLGCAVEADETVTFCRLKPGLVLFPGRDYAGKVTVTDIGMPDSIPSLKSAYQFMLEPEDIPQHLPLRVSRSHKGLYGHLLMVAGCKAMTGAAIFSGRAAYKMGTGLVDAAMPKEAVPVLQMSLPEAVTTPYDTEGDLTEVLAKITGASAVLVEPGLGREPYVKRLLHRLLEQVPAEIPLILDADGLNYLAEDEYLQEMVRGRKGNTILTPHMGEAARLLDWEVSEIMKRPRDAVSALKNRYQSVAVLKDAMTLVCAPNGQIFYNSTGNNGMSTAGSGDVLAGMIGGLCAEGVDVFRAAYLGVYLHGAAGDAAKQRHGAYGMLASDIVDHIYLEKIQEKIDKSDKS